MMATSDDDLPRDRVAEADGRPTFDELYDAHFDFAYRMLGRLGVPSSAVPDAVQEVFVVVHRRLGDLRNAHVARSFLYGVVLRVARSERRRYRNTNPNDVDPDALADRRAPNAEDAAADREAAIVLDRILGGLDDDRREVLVLHELEELAVPEIATLLDVNVNTVYTRLRRARHDFDAAVARHHARERGGRR